MRRQKFSLVSKKKELKKNYDRIVFPLFASSKDWIDDEGEWVWNWQINAFVLKLLLISKII